MSASWLEQLKQVPSKTTSVRFIAVPARWVCGLLGARFGIGLGHKIGQVTDLLDGIVARLPAGGQQYNRPLW